MFSLCIKSEFKRRKMQFYTRCVRLLLWTAPMNHASCDWYLCVVPSQVVLELGIGQFKHWTHCKNGGLVRVRIFGTYSLEVPLATQPLYFEETQASRWRSHTESKRCQQPPRYPYHPSQGTRSPSVQRQAWTSSFSRCHREQNEPPPVLCSIFIVLHYDFGWLLT